MHREELFFFKKRHIRQVPAFVTVKANFIRHFLRQETAGIVRKVQLHPLPICTNRSCNP